MFDIYPSANALLMAARATDLVLEVLSRDDRVEQVLSERACILALPSTGGVALLTCVRVDFSAGTTDVRVFLETLV